MDNENLARRFADGCIYSDTLHYAEMLQKKGKSKEEVLKELNEAKIADPNIKDLMRKAIIAHFDKGDWSYVFTNTLYKI